VLQADLARTAEEGTDIILLVQAQIRKRISSLLGVSKSSE